MSFSAAAVLISAAVSGAGNFTGSTLWNHPYDIKTDGDYAYCAFANGLAILDISDPSSISLTSDLIIPGFTSDIDISGNYAFLVDKDSGLKIVNIMNRSYPFLIATRRTPGRATDIFIAGHYAYIADLDSGLFVFDIADPYDVSLIGHSAMEYLTGVFVTGNYAYVTWLYGLVIYDVIDPEHPYQRGAFPTHWDVARDVFVVDSLAYLVTDSELLILNVSDDWSPALIGSWQAKTACTGIIVSDDYAYISERPYGLTIVNVADPQSPFLAGAYEQRVSWPKIAVDGEIVYLADAECDLLTIDVSDLSYPVLAGTYPAGYYVENVAAEGNYAYVVDGRFGIRVLDISDPAVPEVVGGWPKADSIADISVSGSFGYLIDESSRLEILDLADPLAPEPAASIFIPGEAKSISVGAGLACIAAGAEGLQIVDISDPENPFLVGSFQTDYEAIEVILSGDYAALLTHYRTHIVLVDISNQEAPILFGIFESPSRIGDFYLSGRNLFVASDSGIRIFRIDDSRDPVSFDLLGEADLERRAAHLSIIGDLAFIGHPRNYWQENTCEISVVDISDLNAPEFMGDFSTPGFSHRLRADDRNLYIADGYSLLIMAILEPTDTRDEGWHPARGLSVSQNYPNPFNARTTFGYYLPQAADIRFEIYDVLGRRIETLINGHQPAGSHDVIWNAAGEPSGIYFFRLQAGDNVETGSCLLLK